MPRRLIELKKGEPLLGRSALRCRRYELADILGLEVRVALELVPRVVERELRDLVDLVAAFEQATRGLVPQVVEAKVLDPMDMARAREGRADASWIVGKMYALASGLRLTTAQASGVYLNRR